jgi:PAS domain S-box-containing protein
MYVALRQQGKVTGFLSAQSYQRNAYTHSDLAVLQALADQCAGAMARIEMEAALRTSEEQLRAMFELASVGMAQADPRTGRWLRVNQKMCMITGYSNDELLRMHISELTHPEDRQRDWEAFQRVVRDETPDYRMEKRYLHKDGTEIWVNVNMTVIRDAAGQPMRTMAAIEDITERRQAEEKLKLFRMLIDRSNDAIEVLDSATGRLLDANESGCRALGYTRDEMLSLTVFDLTPEVNRALFDATNAQIKKAGHATLETLRLRKDGTTYPVEVSLSPVTLDRAYMVAIVRDITERKRAEESHARLATAVEQATETVMITDI